MKHLYIVFALLSVPAFADDYRFPGGPLEAFGCPPVFQPQGTVCYTGYFFGRTLSSRPVEAYVKASLIANTDDSRTGTVDRIVRISIPKINDPTDSYHDLGSIPVLVTGNICSYSRSCYWSTQNASLTMNRTYGQRFFENAPSFDFHVTGNSGSESTQVLTSIDVWLPKQQYPITVKFSNW